MSENKLSIHTETGNLYFDGMNTGESLYDFIINQQDETKKQYGQHFLLKTHSKNILANS